MNRSSEEYEELATKIAELLTPLLKENRIKSGILSLDDGDTNMIIRFQLPDIVIDDDEAMKEMLSIFNKSDNQQDNNFLYQLN